ncbi:MAG: AAA family ATPase [Chloroflexi bacterium]|nr:AAA family ATPase [Chloroflexota bacterium]
MPDLLSINTLGGLSIVCGDQPVTDIASRKAEALLVYLAQTGQPQPRDVLAELFWPERDQTRSLSSLRVTLTHLRKELAAYISATRHTLAINADSPVWLDTDEFDDQMCLVSRFLDEPESLTPTTARNLDRTVDLVRGDFLTGFHVRGCPAFEDWMRSERERLQRAAIHALDALIHYDLQTGRYAAGVKHASRLLELDPLHESAHRHLMYCLASSGQREAALAQYETCARLLADEVGIGPDAQTVQLFEDIRAGDLEIIEQGFQPRHNLPAQITPFVGRTSELGQVHRLLEEHRLVTLVGPGGIGKTRLALEAAAQLVPDFAQGVFFVPLVGLATPDEIVPAIAHALGFQFGGDQRKLQDQLLQHLQQRHLLLVLDNFEHLLDGAPLVTALLHTAPDVRVLATSRERLNLQGEVTLPLDGLEVPENDAQDDLLQHSAVRLLVENAWHTRHDLEAELGSMTAAARVCRLVDGMPLGILLAATWTDLLTFDEIADEIARSLDFLAADVRDMPARHRSMRAVFESSWQRLTEAERDVLMKLSVFRDGFSRPAAQQVTGASLRTLNSLVAKSLVRRRSDGRFELHELLRQFANDALSAYPAEKWLTLDRHCAFYAHFFQDREADLRGGNQRETILELDNIRAMWQRAVQTANHDAIHRAGMSLNWLCQRRGTEGEGLMLFTAAVDALRAASLPDDPQAAHQQQVALGFALAMQAHFAFRRGERELGARHQAESRALLRALDARAELAAALLGSGYWGETLEQSDHYFAEAIAIYEELGLEWGIHSGWALRAGVVLLRQHRYDEIIHRMKASLAYNRRVDGQNGISFALALLASIALKRGEYETAKRHSQEGLLIAQAAGLHRHEIEHYWGIGLSDLALGNISAAKRAIQKGLALHDRYGIGILLDILHADLGHIAILEHDTNAAHDHFFAALQVCVYPLARASAIAGLALLAGRAGDPVTAVTWLAAVQHSPVVDVRLQATVETYLAEMEPQLAADDYRRTFEHGQSLDFEAISAELPGMF